MFLVDYCRNCLDFDRIEVEDGVDDSGYWSAGLMAAMIAVDLQSQGCEVNVFEIVNGVCEIRN